MGCVTSSGVQPSHAKFSPIVKNLNASDKQRIAAAVQKDDLGELAVLLEETGSTPNSEISDQGMMWMINHLCCRWNADSCLEFLLKQYFVENPKAYIDYVNAVTFEGYSPLHLCAIWNADKCFNVLHYYGGLNLTAKDKNYKTPYDSAVENRSKRMQSVLKQYLDIKVTFTNIQAEKLLSGEIISEDQMSKKSQKTTHPDFKLDSTLYKITDNLFNGINQQSKQAEKKKKDLEGQKQRLLQIKLKKELQADEQKKKLESQRNQQEDKKQELKQLSIIIKKEEKQIQKQLKSQEEELAKIQLEQKKAQQQEQLRRRTEQIKKAEQASLRNDEQGLTKRLKMKLNAVSAFKKAKAEGKIQKLQKSEVKPKQAQSSKARDDIPEQIMKQYEQAKNSGSMFVDKEFPAQNSTLGDPKKAQQKNLLESTVWLRPSEIFQSDFKLFDGIDPNDIKQGSLGVCYMLATISALAKNPKNIQNLFAFSDLNVGFYVLRLYINGRVKFMVIDDLIPCRKLTKGPLFTQPIGNQLWVLLLEKCWAKAVGDYLSAQAMTPDHVMQDLSGAPGHGAWFDKGDDKTPSQKLQQIAHHLNKKHIVVLTSGQTKQQGIASNHAYTCLDAYQTKGRYIFKIRNPWGRFEWNGEYGESSSLWTEELKKQVGFQKKDDGIFYLTQNELLKTFVYYSISEIFPNYCYTYEQFQSDNREDIFFKFKLSKKSNTNIRITQPFDRMVKDSSYKHSPMIFQTGQITGDGKVKFLSEGHQRVYWGAKSVHAFNDIMQQLEAGQYFVRIKMLWNNSSKYNSAVLAAYASTPIQFERLQNQQGLEYAKQLMWSFGQSKPRSKSGGIYYKILTMRGQFVFVGETDEADQHSIKFICNPEKMQKCELDYGKINQTTIQVTSKNGKPGIGTAARLQPSQGGTTGSVSIQGVKK